MINGLWTLVVFDTASAIVKVRNTCGYHLHMTKVVTRAEVALAGLLPIDAGYAQLAGHTTVLYG